MEPHRTGKVGEVLPSSNAVFEIPENLQSHLEREDTGSGSESSWTLGRDSDQTTASPTVDTPTMQSDEEGVGGGEWEEVLTTGMVAQARWPQS